MHECTDVQVFSLLLFFFLVCMVFPIICFVNFFDAFIAYRLKPPRVS